MLIPYKLCAKITAETVHRLGQSNLFTAFEEMDSVAHEELRGGLGRLERKNKHEVDEATLRNTPLARAIIYFARDASGNVQAIPWVRSPQSSRSEQHYKIGLEFKALVSKLHEGVELDTPLDSFPDTVGGLVVPYNDGGVVFLGNASSSVPKGHRISVNHLQQHILDEYGLELHAQMGNTFLRAHGPNLALDG